MELTRAALDAYRNDAGDFPPSAFRADQGPVNDWNVGSEAMVVALWSNGREAGGLLSADTLVNTDLDRSTRRLTDFGTNDLLELPDSWGNPLAYLHHRDYGRVDPYRTADPFTGELLTSHAEARRNEAIGRYASSTAFQLISAGPDGRFGTEDDVVGSR